MSLGTWDPKAEQPAGDFKVDQAQLKCFIAYSQQDQLGQLQELISAADLQQQAQLMQLDKDQWFSEVESYSDEELEQLMRFFTLAEKLPGWEAGAQSPVIWIGKVLKKRGTGINRELVLWIKANSDNQYLPHGALL